MGFQLVSKGLGFLLPFALAEVHSIIGLRGMALIFASIPSLAFFGLLCILRGK